MESQGPVGIVGLGAVGSALKHICEYYHEDVRGYDVKGDYDWAPILGCRVIFVCVPTPEGMDGRLDCSAVDEVLSRLSKDHFNGIVVIKSTVRVGCMPTAKLSHPDLRLVYCPEFLRERSRLQWTVCPDRVVLAGDSVDIKVVLKILSWADEAEVIITDFTSAEVGKLAHNAYIATKVSFTNEMEAICEDLGANPDDVMDIVTADRRVVCKEHLKPHLGPYGGKCVPKDVRELIHASINSHLLRAVEDVNQRSSVGWVETSIKEPEKIMTTTSTVVRQ